MGRDRGDPVYSGSPPTSHWAVSDSGSPVTGASAIETMISYSSMYKRSPPASARASSRGSFATTSLIPTPFSPTLAIRNTPSTYDTVAWWRDI